MKIYPSKANIVQTPTINLTTDIPLAYIDTESKDYTLNIVDAMEAGEITPVLPYTTFPSYEIALFKPTSKTNLIDSTNFYKIDHSSIIQRVGNEYQYIPLNSITFEPETFNYNVIVKKNLPYIPQRTYNIKIGCIDNINNTNLSEKLIRIFGDAPSRGICPNNIWVNNKDLSIYSLTNNAINNLDFIFISSKDGKSYQKYDPTTKVFKDFNDFNKEYLSKQTNVWMSIDHFPLNLTKLPCSINNPTLYNNVETSTLGVVQSTITKELFTIDNESNEEVTLHTIFNTNACAVIKEYKDKGFMIYTPSDFFMNIEKNINIFYEILFYVYRNSYLKSESINQWITDKVPDYVITNNKLTTIDKFLSNKTIPELFHLSDSDVTFSKIIIDKENVIMKTIYNNYLTFEKKFTGNYIKYADPDKMNDSMVSIYTPQKQIIYFDEFVYTIQDSIKDKIKYKRVDNSFVINLRNFKNSYHNINIGSDATNDLTIPLTRTINYKQVAINNTDFYICCKENILSCYAVNEYKKDYGIIIARINISKTDTQPKVYDMRRRGGGLPENAEDDFNMLDIGHLYGLAYRKAGTVVITLPTKLKPYKDLIKKVVSKHIVAEKYPVIIFEDKEK